MKIDVRSSRRSLALTQVITLPRTKQNPDSGYDDRDAGKNVARFGTERTLATHSAESPGQTAAATSLQKNQSDQETNPEETYSKTVIKNTKT